jgi:hypothetical protein
VPDDGPHYSERNRVEQHRKPLLGSGDGGDRLRRVVKDKDAILTVGDPPGLRQQHPLEDRRVERSPLR